MTALIDAPSFDPLYRNDVIQFPPLHPVYGWGCQVPGCERVRATLKRAGLCTAHGQEWEAAKAVGASKADYLSAAIPLESEKRSQVPPCRICHHRPALQRSALQLCRRHQQAWRRADSATSAPLAFDQWVSAQQAFPGFGSCRVRACEALAAVTIGLCQAHYEAYCNQRSPGGARAQWRTRRGASGGRSPGLAVTCEDQAVFESWCESQPPRLRNGCLNLLELPPLVRAEIQWGLYAHAHDRRHSFWLTTTLQMLANWCRAERISSLADVDLSTMPRLAAAIAAQIKAGLGTVYFDEQEAKAAGYIETHYYGRVFTHSASRIDLTAVQVRWLRDLLWDHMAQTLRSAKCPRTRAPFDGLRQACVELSAFLAVDAPAGGQDPRLLGKEHIDRFVADQRHREHEGRVSLGMRRSDGQPSTVTAVTRRLTFNHARKLLYTAWETGRTAPIGLDPSFVTAMPYGGNDNRPSRNPFSDEVARALADEANLRKLAELDPQDHGVRDMWEAIVMTGRRCSEVLKLRLQCLGRYSGLPLLWHDQTKVGNINEGIRIPEPLYQRLDERRAKTITRFEHRFGRPPTADERAEIALFPAANRNPYEQESISYEVFSKRFRIWVDGLELGHCVAHQARHTLATKLLRHGASLAHIRKYLGQVSDRMAEHYAKVADTELDEILQAVWVAGPGAPNPGELLGSPTQPLDRHQAMALALDLSRRSTPTHGGFCTFQPVVDGGACPWNLDCENCDKFVLSGADLLYWRRKAEQWRSIAERAPDDATADYLHQVFAPTARAIEGLEKALAGLGLLRDALELDLRRPQNYFNRLWSTGFLAADLAHVADGTPSSGEAL